MKTEDKKTLYRLLNEYMSDLLELDDENIKRRKDRKENGWQLKNYPISGVKAQFNHARCITRRLGVDIEKEIDTYEIRIK